MRDVKMIQPSEGTDWQLDIDVINGVPEYLSAAELTSDQRAGMAAFITQGSIPGMLDVGVRWSDYFQEQASDGYVKITNQMNQLVQTYGTSPEDRDSNKQYSPLALLDENGAISVHVIRQ